MEFLWLQHVWKCFFYMPLHSAFFSLRMSLMFSLKVRLPRSTRCMMQVHAAVLSSALSLAVQKASQDVLRPPPSVTTSTNTALTSTVVSDLVPTTASILQTSLLQATQALAGTSGGSIVSPNVHSMLTKPLFSSVTVPLGSAVSDKINSKIWANEFVHLGALLQTAVQQEHFTVGLLATGRRLH